MFGRVKVPVSTGKLAHMVVDIFKHGEVVRPVEVRASVERRRRWSAQEKGRIVVASFAPGANASDVARQHDISPQHLFQWRHAAKAGRLVLPLDDDVMFAPVVLDAGADGSVHGAQRGLEVEIAGAVVRVTSGTDLRLLTAVVRALKAAA
jgi:transposase